MCAANGTLSRVWERLTARSFTYAFSARLQTIVPLTVLGWGRASLDKSLFKAAFNMPASIAAALHTRHPTAHTPSEDAHPDRVTCKNM